MVFEQNFTWFNFSYKNLHSFSKKPISWRNNRKDKKNF
ncbi:hypothetical protein BpHYR1_051189 [Brachionus plicatilis]|uniref:Uncharacterized protein n=1 Tax=Brachionus plicatilis TaxID=10195 RepID=A0A3M7PL40_BRAPC|nr:hypothetical protein BpHYR1_051189 [Brachionus plicatilis]